MMGGDNTELKLIKIHSDEKNNISIHNSQHDYWINLL
jgi:hypothetical protein